MPQILYIPWFQEHNSKRFPGFKLEKYCDDINTSFQRMILPGDTDNKDIESFSMFALEERIVETIKNIGERIRIVTYSLSAFPTLNAVWKLEEEWKGSIESVTFLHPARNPLYSVRVMDLLRRQEEWIFLSNEHYTSWKNSQIFSNLIGKWNGNSQQFQKDLIYYWEQVQKNKFIFEELKRRIWEYSKIPFRTQENPNDIVVNSCIEVWKWKDFMIKALKSHIPQLSWEEIYNLTA